MAKQWLIREFNPQALPVLPEYPPLIVRLLALRGLTDPEKIENFLNPEYELLYDPFLFQGMQRSVDRIFRATEAGEKIAIYADYDADAITAAAVVFRALQKLGGSIQYYIPDRFAEGYGMNVEAIRSLAAAGVKLVITVDCGTNSAAEARECKNLGVDLIITDHHEITGNLPDAFALINPKNVSDNYPFPYLTGVGVAYKLVQGLFSRNTDHGSRNVSAGWEKWLLDLVAIGTVADLQNLTDENRVLVKFGLKVLAKTRWPGLRAMLDQAQVTGPLDAYTLGFILAPRINAAGRIRHGNAAMELLLADDPVIAERLAGELNTLNQKRQLLTDQVLSEAREQMERMTDKKVIVVSGQDWPKGVVGLVAGRLCEECRKPVLVISTDAAGQAVGSARSVKGFDIVQALSAAKDSLQKYGGHPQAAGFSLAQEKIPALHLKLLEQAEVLGWEVSETTYTADALARPEDITWETVALLEKFGPFGMGNYRPRLVGEGLEILSARTVGAQNKHLKLQIKFGAHILGAIAFGQGFLLPQLAPGTAVDALFELDTNEWNGRKEMQLKIIDVKIKSETSNQ